MAYAKYFILAVLLCLLCLFVPEGMPDTGRGTALSEDEMEVIIRGRMTRMRELGITEADAGLEERIVADFGSYPLEFTELAEEMEMLDGAIYSYIGFGEYDDETWEWTPSSGQVYMFDMEAFDISSMYTDFLHGIMELMGDEVRIADIEEDDSGVDAETGTGIQVLRFSCNGNPYEFRAEAYYDWMDISVIDFMNKALKQEKADKRLWTAFDGGQGIIVFYNTEAWAEQYRKKMGYGLESSAWE